MESKSYTDYVVAQSRRSPCLQNLCQFLGEDTHRNSCRITILNFLEPEKPPVRQNLNPDDLHSLLLALNSSASDEKPPGRLLIVEDLTKDVIETLGSNLDIDPLYFASHIYGPYVTIQSSKPSMVQLPSQMIKQDYLSLQYQRTLEFGDDVATQRRLLSNGNVPRKVMILPPTQGAYVGLVQHSCSILLKNSKGNSWLGLCLVDAPTKTTYRSLEKEMTLLSQPFHGGYEDFLDRPSFADDDISFAPRSSMLEDLVFYWTKERPPSFNSGTPDLLSISYYPLKIVAAEWVQYVEIMRHCIKKYEYSTEKSDPKVESQGLAKLDADIRALQVWGRRCIQTLYKLRSVIKFVKSRNVVEADKATYDLIVEDYEHISGLVETYGARLESMIPVVTSLVQIVDTRRSLKEAANVTRLTNLALLFVPLSFVTGLFSMNDGVTAHGLGLFFSVAVPLCAVVFLVARLPYMSLNGFDRGVFRLRRWRAEANV